jgi:hypothetical protein
MLRDAIVTYKDAVDLPQVRDKALEFCKSQEWKNAALDIVGLIEKKNFDAIRARVDVAEKAGSDRNVGHVYKDELDFRLSDSFSPRQ